MAMTMKAVRLKRGLTQEELAHRARVSLRTVQRAEQGGNPRRAQQYAIAAVLGISADDLFVHAADASELANSGLKT